MATQRETIIFYVGVGACLPFRAQTAIKISFSLEMLVDHYRMDYIDIGTFAVKKLKDRRDSYINVCCFKQDLRCYLLNKWLDVLDICPEVKHKARCIFTSFERVRSDLTPYDEGKVDLTWQAGWAESSKLTFEFLEEVIYSNVFDGRIKDAKRTGLTVEDFMDYPMVTAKVKAITDAIAAEKIVTEAVPAPANPSESGDTGTVTTLSAAGKLNPTADIHAPATLQPITTDTPKTGFESLSEDDQKHWTKHMKKTISSQIKLIVDDDTTKILIERIRASPLAMATGDMTGFVLFHYDQKKFGESTTRPDVRIPPLRDNYNRLVKALLEARNPIKADDDSTGPDPQSPQAELQPGELAIILDGGKSGNKNKLLGPWLNKKSTSKDDELDPDEDDDDGSKQQSCVPSMLQIVKTEQSLAAWRKKVRGTLAIKQLETCHILSKGKVTLPERTRKHFPGTNCGDTLTDVNIPSPNDVWRLPWKLKKQLYGKKHLILVGGKTETDSPHVKRNDDTVEPVIYHPMPLTFYLQLIDDFFAKRIIDLVTCDGVFAYAALRHRIGYVGICFTQEHASMVEEMLIAKLKVDMSERGDPNYNPQYALAVGTENENEEPEAKKRKTTPKVPKPKAKADTEAAKGKKHKKEDTREAKGTGRKAAAKKKKSEDEDSELFSISGDEDSAEEIWDPLND